MPSGFSAYGLNPSIKWLQVASFLIFIPCVLFHLQPSMPSSACCCHHQPQQRRSHDDFVVSPSSSSVNNNHDDDDQDHHEGVEHEQELLATGEHHKENSTEHPAKLWDVIKCFLGIFRLLWHILTTAVHKDAVNNHHGGGNNNTTHREIFSIEINVPMGEKDGLGLDVPLYVHVDLDSLFATASLGGGDDDDDNNSSSSASSWHRLVSVLNSSGGDNNGFVQIIRFVAAMMATLVTSGLALKPVADAVRDAVAALESRNQATEAHLSEAQQKEKQLKRLVRKIIQVGFRYTAVPPEPPPDDAQQQQRHHEEENASPNGE